MPNELEWISAKGKECRIQRSMLTYELERVLEKEKEVGYIDICLLKSSHQIGTNVNYNYKNKRSNKKKIEVSSVKPRKINPNKKSGNK